MHQVNTKLIQTRLPKRAFDEVVKRAAKDGSSVATWLRQVVLRVVGVDGTGTRFRRGTTSSSERKK